MSVICFKEMNNVLGKLYDSFDIEPKWKTKLSRSLSQKFGLILYFFYPKF